MMRHGNILFKRSSQQLNMHFGNTSSVRPDTNSADKVIVIRTTRALEGSSSTVSRVEPSFKRCSCLQRQKRRWIMLLLSCMIMLGLYYLIKLPASIHEQLKEALPSTDFEQKYQLLYSMAQAPGIVMPIFVGTAVDSFGASVCLLVLSSTCLIGSIISSCGVELKTWWITIVGRFVFGLGFEALFSTNQAFLDSWFSCGEIGYALGISSSISYLGFLLSFVISPACANIVSTAFSFWIGTVMMSVAVLASIIAHMMGKRSEEQGRPAVESTIDEETKSIAASSLDSIESHGHRCPISSFPLTFWLICCSCLTIYGVDRTFIANASGLMLERNLFVAPPTDCRLKYPDQCSSGYLVPATGNPSIDSNNMSCPESIPYISYAPIWPEALYPDLRIRSN